MTHGPLKQIFTLLILATSFGCQPPVTFDEPQPVGKDNLSKFPRRLQGQYVSLSDHSVLEIDNQVIVRIYDYDSKVHLNQLDSNQHLVGDTLVDFRTNERTYVRRYGDSLIAHIFYMDTLFQMDYDNVVRKFKGYYFLNERYNKTMWEVKKVQLSKGELVISAISPGLDFESLKEITETPRDTAAPYTFTMTKKQFRKFVKNDGFRDSEIFVRQKRNDP